MSAETLCKTRGWRRKPHLNNWQDITMRDFERVINREMTGRRCAFIRPRKHVMKVTEELHENNAWSTQNDFSNYVH